MTRGEVEILDGGFFLRASWSCLGVTRYEEKETLRWDCWDGILEAALVVRTSRAGEAMELMALEAIVDSGGRLPTDFTREEDVEVRRSSCDKKIKR